MKISYNICKLFAIKNINSFYIFLYKEGIVLKIVRNPWNLMMETLHVYLGQCSHYQQLYFILEVSKFFMLMFLLFFL